MYFQIKFGGLFMTKKLFDTGYFAMGNDLDSLDDIFADEPFKKGNM